MLKSLRGLPKVVQKPQCDIDTQGVHICFQQDHYCAACELKRDTWTPCCNTIKFILLIYTQNQIIQLQEDLQGTVNLVL